MKKRPSRLRAWLCALDPWILLGIAFPVFCSISVLFFERETFGIRNFYVQAGAALLGFVAMAVLANLHVAKAAAKLHPLFYFLSVGLMGALLLWGVTEGTNKSWLVLPNFPVGIQPSEFVKPLLCLSFAYHLSRVRSKINRPLPFLGLSAHAGSVILLLILTRDVGVAVVFGCFILLMLFTAGLSLWYYAGLFGAAGAALPFVWPYLREYQKARILVGFYPESDPFHYGYQPLLSRDAITCGGLFGRGMTGGDVFRTPLPAAHTDFMFATVCEKLGAIGGFLVIASLFLLCLRAFSAARHAETDCGAFIAVGIGAYFAVQIVINVGMCLGVLPVVGITLPFVSYGGSSLLSCFLSVGIIQSVRNDARSARSRRNESA